MRLLSLLRALATLRPSRSPPSSCSACGAQTRRLAVFYGGAVCKQCVDDSEGYYRDPARGTAAAAPCFVLCALCDEPLGDRGRPHPVPLCARCAKRLVEAFRVRAGR